MNWGLFNGHFEQGPSGQDETEPCEGWDYDVTTWADAGELRRVAASAETGHWSVKGSNTGAGRGGILRSQKYTPVDEQFDYVISMSTQRNAVGPPFATVSLGVSCYDHNRIYLGDCVAIPWLTPGVPWAWTSATIGPGGTPFLGGTRYVRVFVGVQANSLAAVGAQAFVDNVRLGNPCTVYQDGVSGGVCSDRWYDVRCYGAVGDGLSHPLDTFFSDLASAQAVYPFLTASHWPHVEMDWVGWQAAIDAAEAGIPGVPGGRVYGPAGEYRVNWELLNDDSYVTIAGDGYSTHLIAYNEPDTGLGISYLLALSHYSSVTTPGNVQQLVGFTVRDLRLDGNRQNGGLCRSLLRVVANTRFSSTPYLADPLPPCHGVIQNIWAHGGYGSWSAGEGGGVTVMITPVRSTFPELDWALKEPVDIAVSDCHVWDCGYSYAWGIGCNGGGGVRFTNCHSWDNESQGFACWKARDVTLTGCNAYDNEGNQFNLESCDNIHLIGCIGATPTVTPRYSTFKTFACKNVTASGCVFRHDSLQWNAQTVYIFGSTTLPGTSQWSRASTDILLEDCIIERTGPSGRAIWLGLVAVDPCWPLQRIQIRNCDIRVAFSGAMYQAIAGRAESMEITDNHIAGAIAMTGEGSTSNIQVEGNRLDGSFAGATVRDLIGLNEYENIIVHDNYAECDMASSNNCRSFLSVGGASCYHAQVTNNRVCGRVDYVIRAAGGGIVLYPSVRGNHVGGLQVDGTLRQNVTCPPPIPPAAYPNGSTVWDEFAGSGQPMSHTVLAGVWVPSVTVW